MNPGTQAVAIARMVIPSEWSEPPQRPQFAEYTVVLRGTLRVETSEGVSGQPMQPSAAH